MSASANKKLQETMDMILKEVIQIKFDANHLKNDTSANREMLNLIHIKVSDLSSKADLNISTPNITTKTPTKKTNTTTESEKKTKPNSAIFFKNRFKTDPESISFLYSQNEVDKLFKEHENDIRNSSTKKGGEDNCKAKLVYENLIRDHADSKNRIKKLKDFQEAEINAEVVISPEVLENNFSDDETPSKKKYEKSPESDSD